MATQEQDTFATGGRGASNGVGTLVAGNTITAWSLASNGDNWIAQAAPSAYSYNGGTTQGQTTGATAQNLATLNGFSSGVGKTWYDSLVQSNLQRSASTDAIGVIARFKDINNFYHASLNNAGQLVIVKVVGGTSTTLGTPFSFADGNARFTIKLLVQGFGLNGTVNNLMAKIWLVGNSEPGSFQVVATDGSLTAPGLVGVRLKGGVNGNTQSVDTFLAVDPSQFTPAPLYNTIFDLPYGDTNFVTPNNPPVLAQQTIVDLQGIGNGAHIREQLQWISIETAPNLYNFAILDDLVYRCNQAGVRIWQCLQGAPSWRLTRDGYGNNCTLAMPVQAGVALTSISVSALVTGTFIPNGAQLKVDSGGANPETVTINNTNGYIAGATQLTINSWTPGFAHAVGAQIYEATGGAVLPNATDMATFAGLIAARYNGTAGYGKIETLQVFNEEADAQTRVGAQSASWDNGGAIMAPIYVAAWNAIKAVYPSCMVVAGAVRKTPNTSLQHLQNWLTGFYSGVKALGGQVDGMDAHWYLDGRQDWNGTPVPDPTLNTFVSNGGAINVPNIALGLFTMRLYANIYGFSPAINIGEFGHLLFDDGSGFTSVTSANLTAGTPVSSLSVTSIAQNIPDATPIYIDTGGTHPEGPVYAWGTTTSPATSIPITTNPAGHAQSQVAFTPGFNHNFPVNVYAALGGIAQTQTQDMLYSKAMYDAGMANGAAHMFRFTMSPVSGVTVGNVPQNVTGASGAPRSWTQTMSNVYTYMPGYYLTKLYAQMAATKSWQQQLTHSLPLTADAGNLPLSATANPGILTLVAPTP